MLRNTLLNTLTCKDRNVWILVPTLLLISCLWHSEKYSIDNHTGSLHCYFTVIEPGELEE